MKLPRWLVILMLTTSMLSVLAAAGWWWVTWPERTAREFIELMNAGAIDQVRQRFVLDEGFFDAIADESGFDWSSAERTFSSRSAAEVLSGCHQFVLYRTNDHPLLGKSLMEMHFEVKRGTINRGGSGWVDYGTGQN